MNNLRLAVAVVGLLLVGSGCAHPRRLPSSSAADLSGEERFFDACASSRRIRIHREKTPYDLHAVLYTTANLMELEVIRLADWVIDLPLPGAELRPVDHLIKGIRAGYHRLGHSRPVVRVGEFVDALQLRELSLGDATLTYSVATGGTVNPGSGTVVRVHKLIDWVQRVVGDLNWLVGWPAGRRKGLIRWSLPGRIVDDAQEGVTLIVHVAYVTLAKTLDHSVGGVEQGLEHVVNVPRPSGHQETTVFLRLPSDRYRATDLWVHRHRRRVYVGTAEEATQLSHADLFHRRRRRGPAPRWWDVERLRPIPSEVVVVTDTRAFADAPTDLRPYVVPAAWVLDSSSN